ncbi:MAG TPA: hypothetical protein VFN11_22510 [Ktedonobacterales bacterium]|nr:hypothetical protein [Ktedonobacterales bacterium]
MAPRRLSYLVPNIQINPTFLALVVGVPGTTISPYLCFWQASEEVEEITLHQREPRGNDWVRRPPTTARAPPLHHAVPLVAQADP